MYVLDFHNVTLFWLTQLCLPHVKDPSALNPKALEESPKPENTEDMA